jgi:hypothetical protein
MKQGKFKKAILALAVTTLVGAMSSAYAGGPLKGTKCWSLDPVLGKDAFVQLTFKRIGNGQSVFSGHALRADGSHGERVLKMSGTTSKYTYVGNDDAEISVHLLDLTSSGVKLNKDPASVFNESGHLVVSQYAVRLDPDSLNGAFTGLETLADVDGPLTGPAVTYHSQHANNAYAAHASNYLGAVSCDGTVPGFDNCGTVLPLNNSGTLTLIGSNKRQCKAANPFND